ncbi:SDR family oxidoreductase [Pelagibacterales bacterium SAG-MED39]|nr:SDR family oxidoreductase [Pelagibacterales bacterium SAG-MED39]
MVKIKCGVTGHTGSIGRALLKENSSIKFELFRGDITKINDVKQWIRKKKFNYLIHLAAIVPIKEVNNNKKNAYNVNTLGTGNLVNVLLTIENKVKWFFFASTSHVYSTSRKKISEKSKINPVSFYGKTKYLAEKKLKKLNKKNIKVCIGRIFSTTNINQRKNYLVPDLKNRIKKKKRVIKLENLNHYRDFISIRDISKILIFFLKKEISGVINLSTGKKTKLALIAEKISKKYKKKIKIIENNKPTYLVGNNSLLRKIYKKKLNLNLNKMIFKK